MVLLHLKGESEGNQFLYECPAACAVGDISTTIVEIHNLQSKILQLSLRLRERFFDGSPPESWTAAAISLYRAISEAATYASKDQVLYKRCLSPNILRDHLQNIEKELTVSPLMELSGITLSQLLSGFDLLNGDMTQLCWAGKELLKGKRLCDYIGNNEKTKITVRLQSATSAPPHNLSSSLNRRRRRQEEEEYEEEEEDKEEGSWEASSHHPKPSKTLLKELKPRTKEKHHGSTNSNCSRLCTISRSKIRRTSVRVTVSH